MRVPLGAFWRHFGVTLDALWDHFGYIRMILCHFRITLESLWIHFGCMRVDVQKTFIFPNDFNDFIKHWGSFGFALGLLCDNFWHMKVTFGAFRGHFCGYFEHVDVEFHV